MNSSSGLLLKTNEESQTGSVIDQARLRRMEWRCRRGMLELDLLFTPFISEHLASLNSEQIAALDTLLNLPDNVLWGVLASGDRQHDQATQTVIHLLNPAAISGK